MHFDLHAKVRSTRLHSATTESAVMDLIPHIPMQMALLAAGRGELVAAFERRSTTNDEAWRTYIFGGPTGTLCYTLDLNHDPEWDRGPAAERSDAFGDGWCDKPGAGMF